MVDRSRLQGLRTTLGPHHTPGDQKATLGPHHTPGVREPHWVPTTLQGSGSHAGSHHTLGTREPAWTGVFLFRGRV